MGERIRECRNLFNITQAKLAETIDVSNNTISNMETGNNDIKLDNVIKLADFFQVSLDYLIKGTGTAPADDYFINRYKNLSNTGKSQMKSVMNTFFPEPG